MGGTLARGQGRAAIEARRRRCWLCGARFRSVTVRGVLHTPTVTYALCGPCRAQAARLGDLLGVGGLSRPTFVEDVRGVHRGVHGFSRVSVRRGPFVLGWRAGWSVDHIPAPGVGRFLGRRFT
ncbi:hypothetical protein DN585_17335 [Intrasporangium calvum]|nr:hypothetical protein DN585_17335 [Intrasporangium calvum]